jgi:ABC-type transport system substrate-binding protein
MRCLAGDSGNPESIFANQKVREAIEYAINKKGISDTLGYGFWEAVNQDSPKACNGYNPDLKGRPYNPEKARLLLEEAGYPNGFKNRIIAGTGNMAKDTLVALQSDLKKVGIDAAIEFQDGGKYFYTLIKGWKDGLLLFGHATPLNLSKQYNGLYKDKSVRLPVLYRPTEVQEVLTKAETVPDFKTQSSLIKKSVRMMSDEAVVIPLWTFSNIHVYHKTLRDPNYGGDNNHWTPGDVWLSE